MTSPDERREFMGPLDESKQAWLRAFIDTKMTRDRHYAEYERYEEKLDICRARLVELGYTDDEIQEAYDG